MSFKETQKLLMIFVAKPFLIFALSFPRKRESSIKKAGSSFNFCSPYMYIKTKENEVLMVATLDIPESLLEEAMVVTKITSKEDVIVFALENLLKTKSIAGLKKFKGKVDLDIDMDSMRGRI